MGLGFGLGFGGARAVRCAVRAVRAVRVPPPIASQFGPSDVTKCLEKGLFRDKKWVKNGSKNVFFRK